MRIGILSKRKNMLTGKIKNYYERMGHDVNIYTTNELCINECLVENDFYILKSKHLFYIYAGYYIESQNIPVIPNTDICFKIKNRIEAHLLLRKAQLLAPDYYMGTIGTLKKELKISDFPLVAKPIMGSSGSKGVRFIREFNDLDSINEDYIYLERFIDGFHYIVYFIGDEMFCCEKKPFMHEHNETKEVLLTDDIKQYIINWKESYNLLFGHLDMVREKSTGNLYVVDPGTFPEFSNWKTNSEPVALLCNLILDEYNKMLDTK